MTAEARSATVPPDPAMSPAAVAHPPGSAGAVGSPAAASRRGLSDPQIGVRTVHLKPAVQTYLAHIFAKLGVSSRAQLAAEVTRQQRGEREL